MKTPFNLLFALCLVFVIFTACKEESETYTLNSKNESIQVGKSFTIEVTPSISGFSYTALNTNIATVSETGVIKAQLVGTTKVVVKNQTINFTDTVTVTVFTNNNIIKTPYLGFGANRTTVDNNESWPFSFSRPLSSGGVCDKYEGEDDYKDSFYYYFDATGYYLYSKATVYELYLSDLETYLSEHFINLKTNVFTTETKSYNDTYYLNPDSSVIVLVFQESEQLSNVEYYPATKNKIDIILSDSLDHFIIHPLND